MAQYEKDGFEAECVEENGKYLISTNRTLDSL